MSAEPQNCSCGGDEALGIPHLCCITTCPVCNRGSLADDPRAELARIRYCEPHGSLVEEAWQVCHRAWAMEGKCGFTDAVVLRAAEGERG